MGYKCRITQDRSPLHMHPVDSLFSAMRSVEEYPKGVLAPSGRIPGIAFFPGGAGLWGARTGEALPPMPKDGVMVLGHDFHSEDGFKCSLAQGGEVVLAPTGSVLRAVPTWATLIRFLRSSGIPLEQCFFTNAYMGLREGEQTTGRFPGAKNVGFAQRCSAFLLQQIEVVQPRIILTLGAWVPRFLAPLSGELESWESHRSLRSLDGGGPVRHNVQFLGVSAGACSVAALTHPSLRGPNVGRRSWRGQAGHDAELAMIKDAIQASGFNAERIVSE